MKSGSDDGVAMNPRSSQQQVVRGISVNGIACYLGYQVPNLTSELDFSYRARTISVEAIDGYLSGTQSVSKDPQMLHDPAGYNAQCESQINLNTAHFR